MRVALLPASGVLGGAERVLLEGAAAMRERFPDWQLHAILPEAGPLRDHLAALGVAVQVLPLPAPVAALGESGGLPRVFRVLAALPALAAHLYRLRGALARLAPKVVHTHGMKMHLLGALARPAGARLVWHLHDFLRSRPATARLLRAMGSRAQAGIAISLAVAADAELALRGRPPVTLVRNRVDLRVFTPDGASAPLAALAGLPPEEPGVVRVGLVATLGLWKGHETFIRAMALLPHDVRVRGYLVGGAVYRPRGSQVSLERLQALAAELGVEGRTGFTGFVEHPAEALRALDVVVHASTQPEPFGLVVAEAMACGRALVTSLAGGPAELVSPGENALAYPPGDAAALARCLAQLARDPALRARLGTAARAHAVRELGRATLAEELAAVYGAGEPG